MKDAAKWHPGLKEEVKDKKTGEVQEKPIDFDKYVHRSIWRAVTLLTRGERYDPEAPVVEPITKLDKGGGGETTDIPVTEGDVERRVGQSITPEDEARRNLAEQWLGAHLDQAGMEVYNARVAGEPLDMLRKKYGNEAVDERASAIDKLLPHFHEWVNAGYQKPENSKLPPMPTLKTPAQNVLPIKRTAGHHELMFLKKFTAGMSPEEKQAAETLYFARRSKIPAGDIVGHSEFPKAYRYHQKINRLSAHMTKAAQDFDKATGRDVYSKIKYRQKGQRASFRAGLPIRSITKDLRISCGRSWPAREVPPKRSRFSGSRYWARTMPNQLYEDKELTKAAEREHRASNVGKPIGRVPPEGNEFRRQISRTVPGLDSGVFRFHRSAGPGPGVPREASSLQGCV